MSTIPSVAAQLDRELPRIRDQQSQPCRSTIATISAKPMPADVQQPLLAVYFNYPRKVFDCIPETDAYAQHRPTPINASQYLGPLDDGMSEAKADEGSWPFEETAQKPARAFGVGSQFGREAPEGSTASRGNLAKPLVQCSDPEVSPRISGSNL